MESFSWQRADIDRKIGGNARLYRPNCQICACRAGRVWLVSAGLFPLKRSNSLPRLDFHQGAMGYIEQILEDGEGVVHKGKVHWIVLLGPVFHLVAGLILVWISEIYGFPLLKTIGVMLLLIVPVIYIMAILTMLFTEIAVTNRRIITKIGFFRRHTSEIDRSKVEGISVDQSLLGRALGYGTVTVTGTGGRLVPMKSIADPIELRKYVRAQ